MRNLGRPYWLFAVPCWEIYLSYRCFPYRSIAGWLRDGIVPLKRLGSIPPPKVTIFCPAGSPAQGGAQLTLIPRHWECSWGWGWIMVELWSNQAPHSRSTHRRGSIFSCSWPHPQIRKNHKNLKHRNGVGCGFSTELLFFACFGRRELFGWACRSCIGRSRRLLPWRWGRGRWNDLICWRLAREHCRKRQGNRPFWKMGSIQEDGKRWELLFHYWVIEFLQFDWPWQRHPNPVLPSRSWSFLPLRTDSPVWHFPPRGSSHIWVGLFVDVGEGLRCWNVKVWFWGRLWGTGWHRCRWLTCWPHCPTMIFRVDWTDTVPCESFMGFYVEGWDWPWRVGAHSVSSFPLLYRCSGQMTRNTKSSRHVQLPNCESWANLSPFCPSQYHLDTKCCAFFVKGPFDRRVIPWGFGHCMRLLQEWPLYRLDRLDRIWILLIIWTLPVVLVRIRLWGWPVCFFRSWGLLERWRKNHFLIMFHLGHYRQGKILPLRLCCVKLSLYEWHRRPNNGRYLSISASLSRTSLLRPLWALLSSHHQRSPLIHPHNQPILAVWISQQSWQSYREQYLLNLTSGIEYLQVWTICFWVVRPWSFGCILNCWRVWLLSHRYALPHTDRISPLAATLQTCFAMSVVRWAQSRSWSSDWGDVGCGRRSSFGSCDRRSPGFKSVAGCWALVASRIFGWRMISSSRSAFL